MPFRSVPFRAVPSRAVPPGADVWRPPAGTRAGGRSPRPDITAPRLTATGRLRSPSRRRAEVSTAGGDDDTGHSGIRPCGDDAARRGCPTIGGGPVAAVAGLEPAAPGCSAGRRGSARLGSAAPPGVTPPQGARAPGPVPPAPPGPGNPAAGLGSRGGTHPGLRSAPGLGQRGPGRRRERPPGRSRPWPPRDECRVWGRGQVPARNFREGPVCPKSG